MEHKGDFEAFYLAYPRKVGRPKAETAFRRAAQRATVVEIMAGLLAHLPYWETLDERFIPHPTSWLNRDGWADQVPKAEADKAKPRTTVQRNLETVRYFEEMGAMDGRTTDQQALDDGKRR